MSNVLVQEANEKLQEIEIKIQEFFNTVNDVLSWVPGFLSDLLDPIERGLNELNQKISIFWGRVNQFINEPGNSDRLKDVAEQWRNDIGNVANDIASRVSLDKLKTNVEWEGRGAEAYKGTVPAQVEGLEGIKGLADQMQTSLNSLADGIDDFWLAIKIAFGVFAVGAAGAVIAAVTVVGMPAAIGALVAAIGVSVGLITTAILALNSFVGTIGTEQTGIQGQIDDIGTKWGATVDTGAMDQRSDWEVN